MRFASVTTLCQFLDPTNGHLPLSYTAQYGRKVVVKMLVVQDNVEVNTKDDHGHLPLSLSTKHGNEVVVEILLRQDNVEVNTKDRWGFLPLSYAAEDRCKVHNSIAVYAAMVSLFYSLWVTEAL